MNEVLNVLCLEDSPRDAEIIREFLIDAGYDLNMDCTAVEKEFVSLLQSHRYDIILADFKLPGFDGFTALRLSVEICPDVPFICISGTIGEETAVELLQKGAVDYILKDRLIRLPSAIQRAIEQHNIQIEKRAAELLLKENEAKLQSIFSAAPVGIGLLVGKVFIEVNDTFCKMTGYSRKEMLGKNAEAIYAKDEQNESAGIVIYKHIAEKGTGSVETRFKCKDGRILNILLSSTPLDKDDLTKGITFIAMDITERKLAEEALQESEGKFKAIFQNSNDAIMLLNKDGFFDCNPRTLELFKVNTKEEFIKFHPAELSPPVQANGKNSFEAAQENINIAYREGYNSFDWIHRRTDGEDFYAEALLSAFDLAGKRVLQATIRDITERKHAEERIIQERKMLRTLIDNLPDVIYVKDIDCRKVIANKADVLNIGFNEESEVIGKTDIELFPGQSGKRGYADDKKVINLGKVIFEHEEDFVDSKGGRRWLLTTKIPLQDNDGRIIGLVGIGHDITERKRADEELVQSYAFSESLLKTIPFGMDIVDETGTVLFQSDNFKRLFGENAIGKKCWELYRDDKKQCKDCPLIKGITIGETEAYESHGVLGNRIFEISHTGMMYNEKKAMLEIFQDITERKENEQKLIWTMEKAEESNRLKSAFLTNMSHEIRTPMNGILGFTELLKEPLLTVEEQQDFIQTIQISGARMLNTINSIVDMSKIESGLISVDIKETNLNEKMEFTYKFFKPEVESKGLQFLVKTSLTAKEANIKTDNEKVYGILTNLVRNAIKFTYEGSIEFGYDIVKTQYAASLQFFVKDTGVGIPEYQKELIFERFRQGSESHNRGYEGSGLGLSISKSYVEMLGGKIWVESEEGKGSIFYFTIPYYPVSEEIHTIENVVFTENKEVQLKSLKILIVEDDEISHALLTRTIQKISREVLHAITGVQAIEACRSNTDIDLILMDIRMPQMNGLEATQQIRQFNKDVIIIAQTAYGFSGDCEKALEAGCNDYISKPINRTLLFELIKKYVDK